MPIPTLFMDFRLRQLNGNALNWAAGGPTIKIALLKPTRAPVTATDTLFVGSGGASGGAAGIAGNEVTGGGYTAGGVVATGRSVAIDGTNVEVVHDDVEWAQHASGFADARYAVWYNADNDRLIMALDLASNRGNVNGPFKLDINATTGLLAG